MRRKCKALFPFVAVASDAARRLQRNPSAEGRNHAVSNEGDKMRVIPLNELKSLASAQLLALYGQISTLLKELPENSDDYLNALANLHSIRSVLAHREYGPS